MWLNSQVMISERAFSVGPVEVGRGALFLIGGPCVLESESHARRLAEDIVAVTRELKVPYIFKASYDKANRTSIRSFRGPGLVEGAKILRAIAKDTGLPVLTDVHTPEDCARLSDALGDVELRRT
jgi:2-dehydro-3-deoxyphosphooctonate aldolase (KDO 8-P synthase)